MTDAPDSDEEGEALTAVPVRSEVTCSEVEPDEAASELLPPKATPIKCDATDADVVVQVAV